MGIHGLAYIYCNYKESNRQTTRELLACLLQQLVQQLHILPDAIIQLYDHHIPRLTKPSLVELSNVLGLLISEFPKTFVIVDALDECTEGTRSSFLAEMRKLLPKIHLLITSRPHIELDLPGLMRLKIRANDGDITSFLNARIDGERRLNSLVKGDLTLQREIIAKILDRSQGMYVFPENIVLAPPLTC